MQDKELYQHILGLKIYNTGKRTGSRQGYNVGRSRGRRCRHESPLLKFNPSRAA
ncbi:hypothetical protein [Lignipirellula cremea]|uniref:Uncharacterized protein n=1 Tax=Lignipirellula cremea TaxID=2528010 RepID=A0A518E464_9BACT|nr:hypothetical protein [Lignipirellula cremea]QDU98857.1 hypothetical protein Pla8534_67680 [Lignipirellula cremea]